MTKFKLTEEDIKGVIKSVTYTVLPSGKTTICELLLRNGYAVIGVSAVIDVRNYIKEKGEELAYKDALRKVWELEGYVKQQELYEDYYSSDDAQTIGG